MQNKILIVDESEHFVSTIVNRLMNYGYEYIYTARSGVESTDKIALIKPNIIVLDTNLSDMDSFELCSRVKRMYGDAVKVLLMVRMTDEYDPKRSEECNADGYVIKTFDCIQLLTEIKKALFILSNEYSIKDVKIKSEKKQTPIDKLK